MAVLNRDREGHAVGVSGPSRRVPRVFAEYQVHFVVPTKLDPRRDLCSLVADSTLVFGAERADSRAQVRVLS